MLRFLLGALQVEWQEARAAGSTASNVSKMLWRMSCSGDAGRRCTTEHTQSAACHAVCWAPCSSGKKQEQQEAKQAMSEEHVQGTRAELVRAAAEAGGQ
jgi:hypothetical protein